MPDTVPFLVWIAERCHARYLAGSAEVLQPIGTLLSRGLSISE